MEIAFDPDRPRNFKKWISNFEIIFENRWEDANFPKPVKDQLKLSTDEGQKFMYRRLLEAVGQKGRDFLDAQVISKLDDSEKTSYAKIKQYLLNNCQPKINYINVYGDFITSRQRDTESLVEFIN